MQVGLGREAEFMGLSKWLKIALRRLFGASRRPSDKTVQLESSKYSLLTRFIFHDNHLRKLAPAKAKPGAFLPRPTDLKISAMWRDALPDSEIWKLGDFVGSARAKQALARADFDTDLVSEAKLIVEADPAPHPRHVNLSGWPIDKAEQKSVALLLCARSNLIQRLDN